MVPLTFMITFISLSLLHLTIKYCMWNHVVQNTKLIIKIQPHYSTSDYVTYLEIELNNLCLLEFWIPLTSQTLIPAFNI